MNWSNKPEITITDTKSVEYLQESLDMLLFMDNKVELAWNYYNLGTAYRLSKNPKTKETLDIELQKAQVNND